MPQTKLDYAKRCVKVYVELRKKKNHTACNRPFYLWLIRYGHNRATAYKINKMARELDLWKEFK